MDNEWFNTYRFRLKRVKKRVDHIIKIAEESCDSNKSVSDTKDLEAEGTLESISYISNEKKRKSFGQENEQNNLQKLLDSQRTEKKQKVETQSESSKEKLVVIPIVGIGGVGKTTLAKVIYNELLIPQDFDLRAWVYVSNSHDTRKILFDIIDHSEGSTPVQSSDTLQKLSQRLVDIISHKNFFLVLDNVPTKFIHDKCWETIKNVLSQGKNKRSIVVTTQYGEVATTMGTQGAITLDVLNDEEYWNLFKCHAFGDETVSSYDREKLEEIARKISNKLKGLPLAAELLGRLLSKNINVASWLEISRKEWWELDDVKNKIIPSLGLSYWHLDLNEKQCLACCAILPNNVLFKRHQIVQMWVAHGYVQSSADEGKDCFKKLIRWFFILPTYNNTYTMHALLQKVALYFSRNECYLMTEVKPPPYLLGKLRHLTITMNFSQEVAEMVCGCKMLRTLLVYGEGKNDSSGFEKLFKYSSSCLFVLDLSYAFPKGLKLPDIIAPKLRHLRYLDIQGNDLVSLPNDICKLFQLQVLNLDGCDIRNLPKDINKLISLRHLYTTNELIENISNVGKLTNLQELATFTVKKKDGYTIEELKEMNELHGSLSIAGLENVRSKKEALSANMTEKKYLRYISMQSSSSKETNDEEIFKCLRPHPDLQELKIYGYSGSTFPSWIQQLRNLQYVCLEDCKKLSILPPFGQLPFLTSLSLKHLPSVKNIGKEFYGDSAKAFRFLKKLKFYELKELIRWEECNARNGSNVCFSFLQNLSIVGCPKLSAVPARLPVNPKELRIEKCDQLEKICKVGGPPWLIKTRIPSAK